MTKRIILQKKRKLNYAFYLSLFLPHLIELPWRGFCRIKFILACSRIRSLADTDSNICRCPGRKNIQSLHLRANRTRICCLPFFYNFLLFITDNLFLLSYSVIKMCQMGKILKNPLDYARMGQLKFRGGSFYITDITKRKGGIRYVVW